MVYRLALIQGTLFFSYLLASNISSILLMKINLKIGLEYLEDLLKKYMRLSVSYFESKLKTDLILRIEDQGRIQNFLTYKIIDFIYYAINVIVFSALLLYYSKYIVTVFLSLSIFSFLWNVAFLRKRKELDYKRFSVQSTNSNIIYEIINGMPDIKISNGEKKKLNLWSKSQSELNKISLKALMLNYHQLWGTSSIDKIRDILIIILASSFVINNQFSLGVMMTISYIMGQLAGSLDRIYLFIRDLQDADISLRRLSEVYSKEEEGQNSLKHIPTGNILIQLENIFFRYPGLGSPNIIKGISLEMHYRTITAIVGNSGCGKTTLVRLLLGFYSPQAGKVLINGQDINDIPIAEWRKKCGCVLQDGYIFSDTIANNISMGENDTDYDRISFVCKVACIHDYIMELPLKYETIIGNEGLELSGGQKQRILIARALYKNPECLIFDEATSSLDADNELQIIKNLYDYFKEKTILIIAHRLSTVIRADNILFMKDGQIAEQGTHDELYKQKGLYYKLVKNQIQLT